MFLKLLKWYVVVVVVVVVKLYFNSPDAQALLYLDVGGSPHLSLNDEY